MGKMVSINKKNILFDEINKCNICKFKYGDTPFFFPMKNQKIMLITACPSIQAMFRPLTSIRFFRTICVALFGDANISPNYIEAIHDKIYWTHMHKCYNDEALRNNDFDIVPTKCMETYIEREVALLEPKIIIAFGRVVAERLFKKELADKGHDDLNILEKKCLDCSKWNTKVLVTGFPKTGLEERFDDIRNILSKRTGFNFMEQHNHSNRTADPTNNDKAPERGLRVNLNFERRTIKQLNQVADVNQTDNSWLEKVVLPNMNKCETVAKLEFFIEDQIKTMLMEVFSHKKNWLILDDQKLYEFVKGRSLNQKNIYKYIDDRWRDAFNDYFLYLIEKGEIFNVPGERKLDKSSLGEMAEKLKELSIIRNCIVHNGGYSPPGFKYFGEITNLPGIRWYVNLVHINDEGLKSVIDFTDDIISILEGHDKMRFG